MSITSYVHSTTFLCTHTLSMVVIAKNILALRLISVSLAVLHWGSFVGFKSRAVFQPNFMLLPTATALHHHVLILLIHHIIPSINV